MYKDFSQKKKKNVQGLKRSILKDLDDFETQGKDWGLNM